MYGTDIAKAVEPRVAKLSDQPCASSTLDEKNDVAVKRIEKSDDCIMIHDDTLVVDLQDEPVKGIEKLNNIHLMENRKNLHGEGSYVTTSTLVGQSGIRIYHTYNIYTYLCV